MSKLRVFTAFSGYDTQCLNAEEWRPVKGYEGYYQIDRLGRLRSEDREKTGKTGGRGYKGKMIKPKRDKDGYLIYSLSVNGKTQTKKAHRLVAEAFIPNEHDYPMINHKDEDKTNNTVENLEWCTQEYNNHYGTHSQRAGLKHRKKVMKCDLNGQVIHVYESVKQAAFSIGTKIAESQIIRCCKGQNKTARGYKWRYCHE